MLQMPLTYMNDSGRAVGALSRRHGIAPSEILVISDDLDLPLGQLRIRKGGSDGGHNGLKHIAATIGTTNYARLRFGIGNDFGKGHQVNFVLGAFDSNEQKIIEEQLETTNEIIKSFCFAGLARTMNQFNKKGNGNKPQENNG